MKSVWLHIVYEFNLLAIQHNRVANGNCEYANSIKEKASDSRSRTYANIVNGDKMTLHRNL